MMMITSVREGRKTMLKLTVVAALLAGSASVALAELDCDANPVPASQSVAGIGYHVFAQAMPGGFEKSYATSPTTRRSIELDGDANPVPGAH
jgi:hypothetical protein